jgi:hypothetical protein
LLDILGGVASNLSAGTNEYYSNRPQKRWLFLALHIQPFLFAWISQSSFVVAFVVWLYTMGASAVVNVLIGKTYQRVLAGSLFAFGVLAFYLLQFDLPKLVEIIYALYMFKLIFGFAVNHQKQIG